MESQRSLPFIEEISSSPPIVKIKLFVRLLDAVALGGLPSQGIKECEKLILQLEARRFLLLERLVLGERFDREGYVGVQVDLGQLDRLKSEPQRDHRDVDAGLEQFHRGGMPETM